MHFFTRLILTKKLVILLLLYIWIILPSLLNNFIQFELIKILSFRYFEKFLKFLKTPSYLRFLSNTNPKNRHFTITITKLLVPTLYITKQRLFLKCYNLHFFNYCYLLIDFDKIIFVYIYIYACNLYNVLYVRLQQKLFVLDKLN
jgi:hypothetical protein